MSNKNLRDVFIVDGLRTPFIKAAGKPNSLSATELAIAAGRPLLARQTFPVTALDEVVMGCVSPAAHETNIARIIALRLCDQSVKGYTVQRNCASGLQALDSAMKDIAMGRHDLVLAGGTEAMSRAPLLYNDQMTYWFSEFATSKQWSQKLLSLAKFRPWFLTPVIAMLQGLTDPVVGLSMGQTAEKLVHLYEISRQEQDAFAVSSHKKAQLGIDQGYFKEITLLADWEGHAHQHDTGIRPQSSEAKLAKLKPVFDKPFGTVTAGNSSQITDGAALLLLASETAVEQYNLPVLGRIVDIEWSALAPEVMGLGPAHAIAGLLQRQQLGIKDIDYWEINEAFAAQVIACLKALADADFCQQNFGLSAALGEIPVDRLNIDGGAIAVGHPVGASGARLPLHLVHILQRQKARYGIASLCIGGGQGGAILIERK